jgi:hypothetical protein
MCRLTNEIAKTNGGDIKMHKLLDEHKLLVQFGNITCKSGINCA